ncbi:BglG family transcription antiterminator [Amphibacillus cookii]|uniref:BglG family transcription antiterminator n=1 Tax=Amphibacillus cookii TaxID=767787 RepID=UPI00195C053C|nr:PRD domain-containing protein [Amphibacillus cookii]MBM7541011.1 transcriptional antiterminator/mannitol/fructose-specific phosphotransferase system IIA component (Ntr-type) [Amphibacillus cookii]
MFNERRKNKLVYLIEESPYQLNSEKIGQIMKLSARTIRKDIKEINDTDQTGFSVANKIGKGYYLNIYDQHAFHQFRDESSESHYFDVNVKEDRIKYVVYLLLNETTNGTIEELAEEMFVSRSTLTNDLEQVRQLLENYNLSLYSKVGKGIWIEGDENHKRFLLLSLIDERLAEENMLAYFKWKGQEQAITRLKDIVPRLFKDFHLYMTDDNVNNLIYHMLIMKDRIEMGFTIKDSVSFECTDQEQALFNELVDWLENYFQLSIPEQEQAYLFLQIKSKVIVDNYENLEKMNMVKQYIHRLIDEINKSYYYDLSKDEQLKLDLQSHIYSMIYRVEHDIRVRNPMEQHIKRYYPLAFEVTMYAVEAIKDTFNYVINQGEIAYLALHIGASLERNYQIEYARHNSCLIVCGSGAGTARMIETTIKKTMPDLFVTKTVSAQSYNEMEYIEEDVVITTIDIKHKNKPVYKVDKLPTKSQLIDLDQRITDELAHHTDLFDRFFSPTLFVKGTYADKHHLIKSACRKLEMYGAIDHEAAFIQSIHERERLGSTVLGEGIAIPHPMLMLAKKTKVVVVILDKPIRWADDQEVELVFLLAISKEDYDQTLNIYDFLVEVIRRNYGDKLINAVTFQQFIELAKKLHF